METAAACIPPLLQISPPPPQSLLSLPPDQKQQPSQFSIPPALDAILDDADDFELTFSLDMKQRAAAEALVSLLLLLSSFLPSSFFFFFHLWSFYLVHGASIHFFYLLLVLWSLVFSPSVRIWDCALLGLWTFVPYLHIWSLALISFDLILCFLTSPSCII